MENKTKAETFIGFAIRARKSRIGVNASLTLKKANLVIEHDEIPEGYEEIEAPIGGENASEIVSNTWEVADEESVAPSIKIVKEKFASIDTILDTINGEVI